ncbi:hypothetical protein CPWG_00036 [Cyanophage MED4-117]|uniref:hypothetical protein n=1 Tax=Cyanophage MED4-117 TaxID=889954 RepID=UPI0002C0734B|nr:hypothetical protein CPWG_00036 [Cyanophage MED4-117]AGH16147.1 hypothetical protein CPWG_00036 [Cyanophage MED4-117]
MMSKKVIYYPEATVLKSYDTFVAVKRVAAEDMVTEQHYSKTTTRQINEFFGGSEKTAEVAQVPQKVIDFIAKFLEEYHK